MLASARPHAWLAPVALAAAVVFLWRLGAGPLADWDEAYYAEIAREILETGDWIVLRWNGQRFYDQPPLSMWLTAAAFRLAGISEFTARLPSALAGVGVVVVSAMVGNAVGGRPAGIAAAAVLLTSAHFVAQARQGTIDVLLAFWTMLAVWGYLRVREGDDRRGWLLAGAASGVGVLSKSVAALAAPGAIVVAAALEGRLRPAWRSRALWAGVGLAVLVLLPWHLAMSVTGGEEFLRQYVYRQIFLRTVQVVHEHVGPRSFYLDLLHRVYVPWVVLAPFAVVLAAREALGGRAAALPLLCLAAILFGAYTLIRTKLPWYIVPLYPPLAVLIGRLLASVRRERDQAALAALLYSASLAALFAVPLPWLAIGLPVLAVVGWRLPRGARSSAAAVAAFLLLLAVGVHRTLPVLAPRPSAHARLAARIPPGGQERPLVVYSWDIAPASRFYSRRPVVVATTPEDVARAMQVGAAEIIVRQRDLPLLAERFVLEALAEEGSVVYARITGR